MRIGHFFIRLPNGYKPTDGYVMEADMVCSCAETSGHVASDTPFTMPLGVLTTIDPTNDATWPSYFLHTDPVAKDGHVHIRCTGMELQADGEAHLLFDINAPSAWSWRNAENTTVTVRQLRFFKHGVLAPPPQYVYQEHMLSHMDEPQSRPFFGKLTISPKVESQTPPQTGDTLQAVWETTGVPYDINEDGFSDALDIHTFLVAGVQVLWYKDGVPIPGSAQMYGLSASDPLPEYTPTEPGTYTASVFCNLKAEETHYTALMSDNGITVMSTAITRPDLVVFADTKVAHTDFSATTVNIHEIISTPQWNTDNYAINSAAYGNGTIVVAQGYQPSYIYYSVDYGRHFTRSNIPPLPDSYQIHFTRVMYRNGIFFVIGENSPNWCLLYSTDGITFSQSVMPTSFHICGIAYGYYGGLGMFIAVGNTNNNYVFSSTDNGQTFIPCTEFAPTGSWEDIAYGNSSFVALAVNRTTMNTANNTAYFYKGPLPEAPPIFGSGDSNWHTIVFGDGYFVAINTSYSRGIYSPDGINFAESQSTGGLKSLIYANNSFMGVSNNRIRVSRDHGNTFTNLSTTITENDNWHSILCTSNDEPDEQGGG